VTPFLSSARQFKERSTIGIRRNSTLNFILYFDHGDFSERKKIRFECF